LHISIEMDSQGINIFAMSTKSVEEGTPANLIEKASK